MGIINFVRDYERLGRFRFGTFEGMLGPGVVFAIPILHQITRLDTRIQVLDIPRQTNITKDNASIDIDFLVYMRVDVNEAQRAVLEVEDYHTAVIGLATTTLRAVIGDITLDDVLARLTPTFPVHQAPPPPHACSASAGTTPALPVQEPRLPTTPMTEADQAAAAAADTASADGDWGTR